MLRDYLAVMLGGCAGVAARMWLSSALAERWGESFPAGTLVVNVAGCFVIGVFTALTGPDGAWLASPLLRKVVTIGVLGGFTTFSSFSLQTIELLKDREYFYAAVNIGGSLIGCLLATWAGMVSVAWLTQK